MIVGLRLCSRKFHINFFENHCDQECRSRDPLTKSAMTDGDTLRVGCGLVANGATQAPTFVNSFHFDHPLELAARPTFPKKAAIPPSTTFRISDTSILEVESIEIGFPSKTQRRFRPLPQEIQPNLMPIQIHGGNPESGPIPFADLPR